MPITPIFLTFDHEKFTLTFTASPFKRDTPFCKNPYFKIFSSPPCVSEPKFSSPPSPFRGTMVLKYLRKSSTRSMINFLIKEQTCIHEQIFCKLPQNLSFNNLGSFAAKIKNNEPQIKITDS